MADGTRQERERPRQTNCQQEPNFPRHQTVIFSLRYPGLTCHRPTRNCRTQEPHNWLTCGENFTRAL